MVGAVYGMQQSVTCIKDDVHRSELQYHHVMDHIKFIFAFCRNYMSTLYRFQDIVKNLPKVCKCFLPKCILQQHWGSPNWDFTKILAPEN